MSNGLLQENSILMRTDPNYIHRLDALPEPYRTASEDLRTYLLYHEDDIAIGINDFDDLRTVFFDVFKREAVWVK